MRSLILHFVLISCAFGLSNFTGKAQTWYKANNPFGGNILEIHETATGDLLCGTGRGLYKSTDDGESWQPISGDMENAPVLDVETTSNGMYISLFFYQLRRSFDAGQTWETIPAQNWTSLNKIVVNDAGMIFLNTNNSVWRSTNNGDSWTQLTIDNNVNTLRTLEVSPDGELFAGTYNSRIYRSVDNGDNWTELFSPAGDIGAFGFDGDDVVYATTSFSGVYKSVDNGDNWTLLPALPGTNGGFDIDVNSAGEVFAAHYDDGVLKSVNGGTSWTDITYDLVDPTVRKIFLNSNDELFAGTAAAGVHSYQGTTWTVKNQGISAIFIERFISIDGVLYACTSNGVFISNDGGQTWQQSISGMDDPDIYALAKAPNGDLYAGGEKLYYTTDGINWNDISQGFPDSEVTATDIWIEPNGRVIVATDDYGIRYTDNQGQSWTYANTGLDDVTMNFIRKNDQGYFFTADGYNLYRTNDLSGTWETINTGLADTDIEEFAVGNGVLFAITYSDGLFKSSDNGDNWSLAIDEDFNNVTVNGNEVYGSSESVVSGGVYFSDNNGSSWNNIGAGLPNVQIEEVTFVEGLGLFANVRDHGLYTLDFSVVVDVEEPVLRDDQVMVFPNPFAGTAHLRLEFDEPAEISFAVYTAQGQIVDHSPRMNLPKGINDLPVGNGLAPGMYIIVIYQGYSSRSIRLVKTTW